MKVIQKLINRFTHNPGKLFLVDFIGALITTLSMLMAYLYLSSYFGLSPKIFRLLTILAGCLCLYSLGCLVCVNKKWSTFISIIATANILYGITSIAIAIIYYQQIQPIGVAYFIVEINIISLLIYIELKVAQNMQSGS